MKKQGIDKDLLFVLFFGIIILVQLIGIALRGFKASTGQLTGVAIAIVGCVILAVSYKNRTKK